MLDEAVPVEVREEFVLSLAAYVEAYEVALREWLSLAGDASTAERVEP